MTKLPDNSPADHGILYIVSTPIGNLEDITFRALRILKESSLIAAEDTRHTKRLLNHYDISTPTISYFEHNRFSRIPQIMNHLKTGKDIAVVTDAGTPGISDPAYRLIRAAIEEENRVEAIPGASASITALVASGLPTDRFIFEGFLPHKKGRKSKLERLIAIDATIIFYESPKRIQRTLKDILEYIGDRPAVIGRELTKMHEELVRGKVSELLTYFNEHKPRGEFVLMIGKDDPNVYF
ncbi:MAG: 16S rRNA (cytidine(1402)-2'-O)-methyltransferase [Candidatus Marinimicrobia bacterium]|jgi:16S rRNA (cytidine1402-2'-O)-methyltransferase|nr:16S rRNA (cytidine(1402)-2'-O)-methyltransferase [Candidatus Neomarinimicrobiota bacterium]MBT3675802.1 16S rRNA (cytidine(1402)-2'-O)-methyltransferase [Candidatus Neomarinimicrobiota bacterium]MBT3762964.1 16S rRNA (cytidine(1402)-2'-O)-methyltransferase [Candidatus Neomarinimicrobiota bacterium]MBT4069111.1 16S rRNA (cytidine(1402)-2'-O)-methyltransferase [Candidatus Neomarinimicrobiota bacterium]MBT4271497.1 16S rRNA (cytidine(1402)-2'-O)-methyltransferase [Candidatus Neomarinimicrobiota